MIMERADQEVRRKTPQPPAEVDVDTFEAQMKIARKIMAENRGALAKLAKL